MQIATAVSRARRGQERAMQRAGSWASLRYPVPGERQCRCRAGRRGELMQLAYVRTIEMPPLACSLSPLDAHACASVALALVRTIEAPEWMLALRTQRLPRA